MKKLLETGMVCIAILSAASCASPGKRTAIGAGAGAATGGAVGAVAGGWKGAAIGAVAGGAVGAAIGNRLDKQAQELAEVANTKRTEEGILVNLKNDLLFDTGSDVLKPDAVQKLSQLGDILAKYPDDRIRIEGYTDSTGSTAFNEELSQRRAQAVRSVLTDRGVSPKQIMVIGLGKAHPIASNKSESGRSKNRRVELHITMAGDQGTGAQQQAGQAGEQGTAPVTPNRDTENSDRGAGEVPAHPGA